MLPPKLDHHIAEVLCGLAATGSAVVAVIQSRFDPDIVAVLGAMLAAVVAVIEARKKDRSTGHTISVLIASAFLGSVMPGTLINLWSPDLGARLTWHAWAVCGFIIGLLGWAGTVAIMALRSRVPGIVNTAADRVGLKDESNPPR